MKIKPFNWGDRVKHFIPLKAVKYLVIHHTESPDVPATTVDMWHKNKGWLGIGYHFLVRTDGSIEQGRPETVVGAHTLNYNSQAIGICLTGSFMKHKPTPAQMDALEELLTALRGRHPQAKVVRHKDLQATSCPGDLFPWQELMDRLNRPADEVGIIVGGKRFSGKLIDGQTWIPLRAVLESLGHKVTWDGIARKVTVE